MINWEASEPLFALTHFDGRNSRKLVSLRQYFSEFAWMERRLYVMVEYLIWIVKVVMKRNYPKLRSVINNFSLDKAKKIQEFERITNHDLKAIELFLEHHTRAEYRQFVNLGIGSEDINSIALSLILKQSREDVLLPPLRNIVKKLVVFAKAERDTVLVARTHAQRANVTTFGKELAVPLSRLCDEVEMFQNFSFFAKCSGEVGSFQALYAVEPKLDWIVLTDHFIASLGLESCHATTQIVPYEGLVRYLQSLFRLNSILIDFVKNLWLYVLLGYLRVIPVKKEVGSGGMPHKVNPIYFEGAEGGLEFANGVIEAMCRKLPINRLQRDFSDSTVRRNLVIPIAYSILSYQSIVKGLSRISVDRNAIAADVQKHPEIWLETIKAYGLVSGISDMYDRLKEKTRGKSLNPQQLWTIVDRLSLSEKQKDELKKIITEQNNPFAGRIVDEAVKRAEKMI